MVSSTYICVVFVLLFRFFLALGLIIDIAVLVVAKGVPQAYDMAQYPETSSASPIVTETSTSPLVSVR